MQEISVCGKFLKRWEYQATYPDSWETCMQVKKKQNTVCNSWLVHDWERSTAGYILLPCLFKLYTEYIMWNAGLDELLAGIKIAGRNINNLRYADDTDQMVESKEVLKSLLVRVNKENAKLV